MGMSGAERQLAYRNRRRLAGLCLYPACVREPEGNVGYCAHHLEVLAEKAREKTREAAEARALRSVLEETIRELLLARPLVKRYWKLERGLWERDHGL